MANNSYACIMITKVKTGNVNSAGSLKRRYEHNLRTTHTPPNVDPSLTKYNKEYVSLEKGMTYYSTFKQITDAAIENGKMNRIRANAVLAAELDISYTSPENLNITPECAEQWGRDITEWAKQKFGAANIIHSVMHYDEDVTFDESDPDFKTPLKHPHPHVHIMIVPIDDKGRLNYYNFIHGPKSTSDLQTDFYEKVGNKYGMKRGIKGGSVSYEDMRTYKKNVYRAKKVTEKEFEPLETERTRDGYLTPSYVDRVKEVAVRQADQQKAKLAAVQSDFKQERADLLNEINKLKKELEEDREKIKKEIASETQKKEAELQKREHLLSEAALALRDLTRGEDSTQKVETLLITYAALHAGLQNYPDKELVKSIQENILKISKWQHDRDKHIEKTFDITK